MQRHFKEDGEEGTTTYLFLSVLVSTVQLQCPATGLPLSISFVTTILRLLVWELLSFRITFRKVSMPHVQSWSVLSSSLGLGPLVTLFWGRGIFCYNLKAPLPLRLLFMANLLCIGIMQYFPQPRRASFLSFKFHFKCHLLRKAFQD